MKKTYFYVAAAIFCWSTVATVSKLLLSTLDSFQLLCFSSLFAFLFLLVFNVVRGNFKEFKSYKAKDFFVSVIITIPSTVLYYLFYYSGADLMPASQAFIVNYMWPIMSIVFACIVLREKLTWRKIVAILISFAGVMISSQISFANVDKTMLLGAVLCLLGAMSYGLFTALNQKYNYNKWLSMMLGYLASFIVSFAIISFKGEVFMPNAVQWAGFAWNGIFTMAIANVCWVLALRLGNTAKVSNLAYITPFVSLVWVAIFLKEKIEIYSIIGLIMIVLGIFVQMKKGNVKNAQNAKGN